MCNKACVRKFYERFCSGLLQPDVVFDLRNSSSMGTCWGDKAGLLWSQLPEKGEPAKLP